MVCFLLNLKLKGIKNIINELNIDFYKLNILKFNYENYRIKGIFGRNAIGKTGIIKSIEIVKFLITKANYLMDSENKIILDKLINKNTKKFEIKWNF